MKKSLLLATLLGVFFEGHAMSSDPNAGSDIERAFPGKTGQMAKKRLQLVSGMLATTVQPKCPGYGDNVSGEHIVNTQKQEKEQQLEQEEAKEDLKNKTAALSQAVVNFWKIDESTGYRTLTRVIGDAGETMRQCYLDFDKKKEDLIKATANYCQSLDRAAQLDH